MVASELVNIETVVVGFEEQNTAQASERFGRSKILEQQWLPRAR